MNKQPYYGALADKHEDSDYQLAAGVLDIPEAPKGFEDSKITYEQNEVSNCSCTLHAALGALSDLTGIRFNLDDRKSLWARALVLGAKEGIGWYVKDAVELVRQFSKEKGVEVNYFWLQIGSEEYQDAIQKRYSVVTGYKGNAKYNKDFLDDGILDGTDFSSFSYAHSIRLNDVISNPEFERIADSYPHSRLYNEYKISDATLRLLHANGVFFNSGYVFTLKDSFVINPQLSKVSLWAKKSVQKCVQLGIATKWENPQEEIANSIFEWMLLKSKMPDGSPVLTTKVGAISKERAAVLLDKLGLLG